MVVYVKDLHTGRPFMIYTGADISIIPQGKHPRQPSYINPTAANGSCIANFGTRTFDLNLGLSRTFTWTFIIGADFLRYFGLLVAVRRARARDPDGQRVSTPSTRPACHRLSRLQIHKEAWNLPTFIQFLGELALTRF